jgi:hypothetical protein
MQTGLWEYFTINRKIVIKLGKFAIKRRKKEKKKRIAHIVAMILMARLRAQGLFANIEQNSENHKVIT